MIDIYYLENRGWYNIFHFLVFTISGIPYNTDNIIGLYVPYINKIIDNYDITKLFNLYLTEGKATANPTEFLDFCALTYNHMDLEISTKTTRDILHKLENKGYKIFTTLKDLDAGSYNLLLSYGTDANIYTLNTKNLKRLRNFFLDENTVSTNPQRKIYLIRSNTCTTRKIMNEPILINKLLELGFEIIIPENNTFEENIELFKTSKTIIGPHAGSFILSIFCNKSTNIIELIPDSTELHTDKFEQIKNIAESCELSYYKYTNMLDYDKETLNMTININDFIEYIKNIIEY